jgi:hypothetical protein
MNVGMLGTAGVPKNPSIAISLTASDPLSTASTSVGSAIEKLGPVNVTAGYPWARVISAQMFPVPVVVATVNAARHAFGWITGSASAA